MRETRIICPGCKELVPVVDRVISDHNECQLGGMKYVPSPKVFKAGPGAPSIELIASKPFSEECGTCHETVSGMAFMVKVTPGNPSVN